MTRRFGNHRKFQTLKSTAAAFESYVCWVAPPRTPQELVRHFCAQADSPQSAFDSLYRSMDDVKSFGRLAKFDYLTMIGKLGLAPIEPGSTYLKGATGPVRGAKLLFGLQKVKELEELSDRLATSLELGDFRMQVLEDALCNWRKSPDIFSPHG